MTKIYIIYAERQYSRVLIVKDIPNRGAAEEEIDRLVANGATIHKVISGEEFILDIVTKSHLTYPDEV